MQGGAPIKVQVVTSLINLGVDPQYLKLNATSFPSDKTICINDKTPQGQNQLTQIQVDNNFNVNRKPQKAEYSLPHPSQSNIMCMRAANPNGEGAIVQIYNLDTKAKLKNIEINEQILYMNWVNNNVLAMVTLTKVYHSDLSNPAQFVQVFERAGDLANPNCQIIGYKVSSQGNWGALFGISSPDQKQINGDIQLYKIDENSQQPLKGHCCCFGQAYIHTDTHLSDIFAYYERKPGETNARIVLRELSAAPEGFAKYKGASEYPFNPQFPADFPIYMQVSTKYGQLFCLSKSGFVSVFELTTSTLIYQQRITDSSVFIGSADSKEDGIYAIAKNGNVILVQVDTANLVSHIQRQQQIPNVVQLAFKLASRYHLPGADAMFLDQFNRFMMVGDYANAAQTAAGAPGELIRNAQTIAKFKSLQGTPSPLLVYFQSLIQKGTLNQLESLELAQLLLSQNKKNAFDKLLAENKLDYSEPLGDLVAVTDQLQALEIYKKANASLKVVSTLGGLGRIDEANQYASSRGINMDYTQMIRSTVLTNPQQAVQLAKTMVATNPSTNVHSVAEIFGQAGKFKEMSAFLVDCMKANRPEDGPWQTKVLEWNILNEPNIVDAIFDLTKWNQYNRLQIATLCERKQLFQRALENYSDVKDIRRVVLNTQVIPAPWLVNFLGNIQPEWTLGCMQDLLRHNRQNLQLVVDVAVKNSQKLTVPGAIKCFEQVGSWDGVFMFLSQIINSTEDKEIYFKYIEAATKCNQLRTVEQIIQEKPNCYDPVKVKDFLKGLKLPDPKPLIFLCDIHKFVEELTTYLYQNNFLNYIQIYLFQVNPQATPVVLGTLIDQECEERQIQMILQQIGGKLAPQAYEPLIEEFEKRNKLRVLEGWLEARAAEGNQIPAIHNALAKIKIDTNQDPESFLTNNQFYDAKVVGKFCEERDPHLAVIAYKRQWGECDEELIMITNKNALFRLQARYLVERQSKELWASVLTPDNPYRKQVIEQIVQSALPESKEVEQVSTAVKAFMDADLPEYLITLLEKIVLHNHEFGQYKKLQNLLIITAIKSDKTKVMDYINRLDNYDGPEIAKIALGEQYQLYEEAYIIYTKNNLPVQAVEVLLNNIDDIARAAEYSQKVNIPEVWSKLGNAYLDRSLIVEAIDCYTKAKDHSTYLQVIASSELDNKFEQLIKYLLMARENIKDANIDNALVYAYAKVGKNTEIENFISGPNSVDYPRVGDRCYDDKLYEAAKLLFIATKNNSKIASCLVRLKQFQQAIDAAKKANTPKTWKELTMACVESAEFKLAAVAGLNIIVHPDHLEELTQYYEEFGYANEMISLLETGMGLDRAHVGIFTELGVLLAKYRPERLMEHCKQYTSKMNISKLLRVCERYQHWSEAVFLHANYDQYDNAINIMIEHSPIAFNPDQFVNLLIKASNYDLYYKAILFYLDEQPEQLNDLLRSLTTKIDLTKCVSVMRKTGYIGLIAPFLKSVQNANNKEVNECLNEIYLESYDYEGLRQSITSYENFDQLTLAQNCERHQLLEFRRISAYLYRRIQKYEFSIALSKQDTIYRDAIETAQESGKPELVEDLLRFFVQKGEKEFIAVTLYTAYDLIRPDLAMEFAWRFNLFEFVMPYFIQITKELTSRVDNVQKKHEKREKEEEKKANQQLNQNMFIPTHEILPTTLMIGAPPPVGFVQQPPFGMQQQPPFGMQQQQPPFGMAPPPFGMPQPPMGFNPANPFGQQ